MGITRQLQTKAVSTDASQQIVKRQTEIPKDTRETKTVEDAKTTGEETPAKDERKKKNKARPAPLKNLALIRQEDDFPSGSQSHPSQEGNVRSGGAKEESKDTEEKT